MRATSAVILDAIRARPGRWLEITVGFAVCYYLFLTVVMMARFGELPNYVLVSNIFENIRLIWIGTPGLGDALSLIGAEVVVEVGYQHPVYRLALWSVDVMPAKTAMILLLGALVATYVAVSRNAAASCPARVAAGPTIGLGTGTATGVGAGIAGFGSATLFWAVCCGSPNWAVTLALLGFSIDTSYALAPFGDLVTVLGMAVVAGAVLARAWKQRAPQHITARLGDLRHVH